MENQIRDTGNATTVAILANAEEGASANAALVDAITPLGSNLRRFQ